MQTFVAELGLVRCAKVLDRQRLGKQRVETKQILKALLTGTGGWVKHPATRMWRGHEGMLAVYGQAMCNEWIARGYNDSLLPEFIALVCHNDPHPYGDGVPFPTPESFSWPMWWGGPIHLTHRANLIRKNPAHYGPLWPEIPPDNDVPYLWPA